MQRYPHRLRRRLCKRSGCNSSSDEFDIDSKLDAYWHDSRPNFYFHFDAYWHDSQPNSYSDSDADASGNQRSSVLCFDHGIGLQQRNQHLYRLGDDCPWLQCGSGRVNCDRVGGHL